MISLDVWRRIPSGGIRTINVEAPVPEIRADNIYRYKSGGDSWMAALEMPI